MPGRRIATVLMLDVVGSTHVAAEPALWVAVA